MNSEQRRALREALISQGFNRVMSTLDHGDGSYSELWGDADRDNAVVISWGPRSR